MSKRWRIAVAIAVALTAFAVFTEALQLMNRPSTLLFSLGVAIALALFVVVPTTVTWALGKQAENVRKIH
jgi:hypothetical protein